MIFLAIVGFLICKRGNVTKMPWLARLLLISLLFQVLLDIFYDIYHIITGDYSFPLIIVAYWVFVMVHWFFTANYVRVACLFRPLFAK